MWDDCTMDKDLIRQAFTQRLIEALNDKNVEPHRRAATLAKWVGKNPKNPEFARKWLTGRSMPQRDNLTVVANCLEVRIEWLEYGIGAKSRKNQRDEVMALLDSVTDGGLLELLDDLNRLNSEQLSTVKALVKTWLPHPPE